MEDDQLIRGVALVQERQSGMQAECGVEAECAIRGPGRCDRELPMQPRVVRVSVRWRCGEAVERAAQNHDHEPPLAPGPREQNGRQDGARRERAGGLKEAAA